MEFIKRKKKKTKNNTQKSKSFKFVEEMKNRVELKFT